MRDTNPDAGIGAPDPPTGGARILRVLTRTSVALTLGLSIAWMDSRPGWDGTGITAGCLAIVAAILVILGTDVFTAGLMAALPLIMIERLGFPALLLMLLVAIVGAGLAALAKRAWRAR